ncbi:MAG TPA: hypothetical protein VHP61_06795 [Acidobacteriota bacterium]|nr:hypothetical protein [Acidobacteriota bacterium]
MVLGLISFSLAQETKAPATKPVPMTFIGTVDSVTLADTVKGTKSEIVVVNTANTKMSFLVLATTTLYNAKDETIGLDKIIKGNEVNVKYATTAEVVYEAVSIKVTK